MDLENRTHEIEDQAHEEKQWRTHEIENRKCEIEEQAREEQQWRTRKIENRTHEIEDQAREEQQWRTCEIEDQACEEEHRRTQEIHETKNKHVVKEIEMTEYVNDMKVKQQKERLRGEALMKNYQEHCHDEFDRIHV